MKKTVYFSLVALIGASFMGCRKEEKSEVAPVTVKVTLPRDNKNAENTYSGVVEEETGSPLSFQVPGIIESLPVKVGQRVVAGQLIATVNATSLRESYNAAKATLTQAQDAYSRMKQMYERGSLPEIKWVEAQSQLRQAEAMERIALKNLQDSRLTAPFSGVIISKDMEEGQSAIPGAPVVRIGKIGRVNISISVPEGELASIKTGTPARVSIAALSPEVFQGAVCEKGVVANPLTHTYDIKIPVNNPNGNIMPGMIATVTLEPTGPQARTMVLPGRCIGIDERNRNFVWTVQGGHAHRKFIQCGKPLDEGVEIIEGLTPADSVIIEGAGKVSENMAVKIIN